MRYTRQVRTVLALAVIVLLQGVLTPGGGIGTGDISKDDYRQQLPTQSPHTLERACTTQRGICRVANQTPPGQPCYCLANDGGRLDGHVIAWRWGAVPVDVK
jgi:hypothetical protein